MDIPVWYQESDVQQQSFDLFTHHFGVRLQKCNLQELGEIILAFAQLPYENITKILARYSIDTHGTQPQCRGPITVLEDFINLGTGGTCFSLSYTLLQVLWQSGYTAYVHSADMGNRQHAHCAVVVHFERKNYLVDPGYLLGRPVLLDEHQAVDEYNGLTVLSTVPTPYGWEVYTGQDADKKKRYMLHKSPLRREQFFTLWRNSFDAPGMGSILVTQYTDNQRIYLHNKHLRTWSCDQVDKKNLSGDVAAQVEKIFGIDAHLVQTAKELLLKQKQRLKKSS